MASGHGSICHVELFAKDLKASARFYTDLFGWKTSDHDPGYLMWSDTGGMSGGFTTAGSPVTNPAATVYIRVDDITNTLVDITGKGGVVIRVKTEIPGDNGFYALFRDLAGNNIGLWAPK